MTVQPNSIVAIIIVLIFSIVFPAALFLYTRKKTGIGAKPFFVGCGVFFVFVVILESIFHKLVLLLPFGTALKNSVLASSIYGGLCAGIFEETGRLVAFKTLLKKDVDKNETALMYGVGHGGFEAFYLLFSLMVTNLIFAININSGNVSTLTAGYTGETLAALENTIKTLVETKSIIFYVSIFERISAVIIHVSASILVWFAVKNKKWWLYPIAIVLHAFLDFIAGFCNGLKCPVAITEIIIFVFAVVSFTVTLLCVWIKNQPKQEKSE